MDTARRDREIPMSLFIDCSYTRLNATNVGITRVVRNLARHLTATPHQFGNSSLICFGHSGFRTVDPATLDIRHCPPLQTVVPAGALIQLLRFISSSTLRTAIVNSLPPPVQRRLARYFSSAAYAYAAHDLPTADIRSGDVVLLADAAWNYNAWECATNARSRGAHVVTMIHDLIPLTHPELVDRLFTEVFRVWLHKMLKCSSALVCNSKATRDEVLTYCHENGLEHPDIEFFHLGCDFQPADGSMLSVGVGDGVVHADRSLSDADRYILVVGSVEKRKRHDLLLDAFERVWETHPDIKLVVVGRPGGGADTAIERLKSHPARNTKLTWITDATDNDLVDLYSKASSLVFCSSAEGYGLPLLEARQLGCRVIASDIPVFRELADEGVVFFPAHNVNALASAIRCVVDAGNTRVPKRQLWTWADSTNQLLDALTRLVGAPGSFR